MKEYTEIVNAYTDTLRDVRRDHFEAMEILRGLQSNPDESNGGAYVSPNHAAITDLEDRLKEYTRRLNEYITVRDSYSSIFDLPDMYLGAWAPQPVALSAGYRYVIPNDPARLSNWVFELPTVAEHGDVIAVVLDDRYGALNPEYSIIALYDGDEMNLTTSTGFHFQFIVEEGYSWWVPFANNGDTLVRTGITETRNGFVRTTKDRIEQFVKGRVGETIPWIASIPTDHAVSSVIVSSNPCAMASDMSVVFSQPDAHAFEDTLDARVDLPTGNVDVLGDIVNDPNAPVYGLLVPVLTRMNSMRMSLETYPLDHSGFLLQDVERISHTLRSADELNISAINGVMATTHSNTNMIVVDRNIQAGAKGRSRLATVDRNAANGSEQRLTFQPSIATNTHFLLRDSYFEKHTGFPSACHSGVSKQADDFIVSIDGIGTTRKSNHTYDFIDVADLAVSHNGKAGIMFAGITADNKLVVIHEGPLDPSTGFYVTEFSSTLTNPVDVANGKVSISVANGGYIATVLNSSNEIDVYAFDANEMAMEMRHLVTMSNTTVTEELTDVKLIKTGEHDSVVLCSATGGLAVHRIHVQDDEVYISGDAEVYMPLIPSIMIIEQDNRSFLVAPYNNHITDTPVVDLRDQTTTVFELTGKMAKVHVVAEATRLKHEDTNVPV